MVPICLKTGWRCGLCGDAVDLSLKDPDPGRPTFDHIQLKSQGGPRTLDNLRLAHAGCNKARDWLSDEEWYELTGFQAFGLEIEDSAEG